MLASLIIIFREIIEAGLIISIVLAATRGVPKRGRFIAGGVALGILAACIIALFTDTIANAVSGMGQEIFNAAVLVIAVIMLTWHNVWMASHGKKIAMELHAFGHEVMHGTRSLVALATVVGIAVLREGAEVVLFMYGIIASGNESAAAMISGSLLGLLSGALLSALMYFGLIKIHTRHLFGVTSWLIALLAAGMATQAIFFLQQAGKITALTNTIWDSSRILSNASIMGKTLHTLIGYTDRPNEMQLIVYIATLVTIFTLMRLFKPVRQPARK
jgi:high-affinity iron transporter